MIHSFLVMHECAFINNRVSDTELEFIVNKLESWYYTFLPHKKDAKMSIYYFLILIYKTPDCHAAVPHHLLIYRKTQKTGSHSLGTDPGPDHHCNWCIKWFNSNCAEVTTLITFRQIYIHTHTSPRVGRPCMYVCCTYVVCTYVIYKYIIQ